MTARGPGQNHRRSQRRAAGAITVMAMVGLAIGPAAVAAPSLVASPTSAAGAAPAAAARQVVQVKPTLPTGTRAVGAVAASQAVNGAVALRPRDAAVLMAYAAAVSTPGSSLYHHYLAHGAFASRFGPSAATVAAVEAELRTAGLSVGHVSSNRLLVDFSGSARAAEAAFGTRLESYRLVGGRLVRAETSAVTLPASIASSVQTVIGLDDVVQAHPEGLLTPTARDHFDTYPKAAAPPAGERAAGGPVACSAATAVAKQFGGLTDTQIANAYGLGGLYSSGDTGSGQTVAIFELEPFARSDIATFDRCFFGATAATSMLSRLKTVPIDGGQQSGFGVGEASLDIQGISALAPGADIDVYEAPDTDFGGVDEYNSIVDTDTAKVISTSWGFCELALQGGYPGTQQLENTIFEQAAAQGQTVFAASGDAGSDDCSETGPEPVSPLLSVDDPGSQPFVVSVGGTTTTDATLPPSERVWNDGAEGGGGGGGISGTWPEPAWQAAATVPGINNQQVIDEAEQRAGDDFCLAGSSGTNSCREVPDVSANADEYTGAITEYYANEWGTVGGTSAAAPIWAGVLADINASAACTVAGGVGFANPELYAVASAPAENASSFTDVTKGDNDAIGVDGGLFPATAGYDMASGLGTPLVTGPRDSHGLAYYLCAMATPSGGGAGGRPSVASVSPPVVSGAGGSRATVAGSGFESTSDASVVSGVQIGTYKVPAAYVDVTSATTITLTVPSSSVLAGAAGNSPVDGNGTYDVIVSVDSGQSSEPTIAGRLTVTDPHAATGAPEVDGVGPSGGNEAGGNLVTVYGSGLTGATTVTFGGVAGADVHVVNDSQLTVEVPAYSTAVACANPTDPTTDVCQVQVRVTSPAATSPSGAILRPLAGAYITGPLEIPTLPVNCNCELAPAPTEYDYLPTPTITSITSRPAGAGGRHYASEAGTTIETINGRGLDILGLEWVDVGPPNQYDSSYVDFTEVSGTQIKVLLPFIGPTTTVTAVPLWVQTLASPNSGDLASAATDPSNTKSVLYAPVPSVTSLRAGSFDAGPTTGSTMLTIRGRGLAAAGRAVFIDRARGGITARTTAIHVVSNDEVTVVTPPAPAGRDHVQICDATSCSSTSVASNLFTYFPRGDPTLASVRPGGGVAGVTVTVRGHNLGFLKAVYFGAAETTDFRSIGSPSDVGSTTGFTVVVPPGRAGSKVHIRVVTVESETVKIYPKSPVNPGVTYHYRT